LKARAVKGDTMSPAWSTAVTFFSLKNATASSIACRLSCESLINPRYDKVNVILFEVILYLMGFGDINTWIDLHGREDANGKGTKMYNTLNETMLIEGLAYYTKATYLRNLHLIIKLNPGIDYFNMNEATIKKVLSSIVNKYNKNPKTVANFKISFRKWLSCSNQKHLLDSVKAGYASGKEKLPEDMLTNDELELLLSKCSHPRDAAIIATLYDSGCRIGELLSMRVKDVVFDDNGAIVTFPEGKTGWRKNRVVVASSYLRVWLDSHEYKKDKENPLFYSLKGNYKDKTKPRDTIGHPDNKVLNVLSSDGVRRQLHIIAKKAGIKRRIHPHLFRHTRATELASHLTEQQLKKKFGWTRNSNMTAKYVHLTDQDVDNAVLKAAGVEVREEAKTRGLTTIRCTRCREFNSIHSFFCSRCGMPLTESSATIESAASDEILMKTTAIQGLIDAAIKAALQEME